MFSYCYQNLCFALKNKKKIFSEPAIFDSFIPKVLRLQ